MQTLIPLSSAKNLAWFSEAWKLSAHSLPSESKCSPHPPGKHKLVNMRFWTNTDKLIVDSSLICKEFSLIFWSLKVVCSLTPLDDFKQSQNQ